MKIVNDYARAYTLLDLIIDKYGEDRIEVGITLLSTWLKFGPAKISITRERVEEMVLLPKDELPKVPVIPPTTADQICKLFGLQTIDQLYNNLP